MAPVVAKSSSGLLGATKPEGAGTRAWSGLLAQKPCKVAPCAVAPLESERAFCSKEPVRLGRGALGYKDSVVSM